MGTGLQAIAHTTPASLAKPALWQRRLVLFTRLAALVALTKGLIHWAFITGIGDGAQSLFLQMPMPWRATTTYFAVVDLVAGVGLWLGAAWGSVVWLLSLVSLIAVEILFPEVFGGRSAMVIMALCALAAYLSLIVMMQKEEESLSAEKKV